MKTLVGTMLICVGSFFTTYSIRLTLLRSCGYTPVFKVFEVVNGSLPYASILILLTVGIFTIVKNQDSHFTFAKLLLILFIALIPYIVYVTLFILTSTTSQVVPSRILGNLTGFEWFILIAGIVQNGIGVFLILYSRHGGKEASQILE